MFTDIVDSTRLAAELGDERWREKLDRHDAIIREQPARFRGREIKTFGDGFLATFDGAARAVRCAVAVRDSVRPLGLQTRAGLHSGEIELRGEGVGGIAVNGAHAWPNWPEQESCSPHRPSRTSQSALGSRSQLAAGRPSKECPGAGRSTPSTCDKHRSRLFAPRPSSWSTIAPTHRQPSLCKQRDRRLLESRAIAGSASGPLVFVRARICELG